jgi:hypothetical protein
MRGDAALYTFGDAFVFQRAALRRSYPRPEVSERSAIADGICTRGACLKIVALAMIGNEADVVECFVRHTLTMVDRLVIILHRSVDGTAEIVNALYEEGLPV